MAYMYIESLEDFQGENVVFLGMDEEGLTDILSALSSAIAEGEALIEKSYSEKKITIYIDGKDNDANFNMDGSIWHLSALKAKEIMEKLQALMQTAAPCHHYVDIEGPYSTLVLSFNEDMPKPA